MFSAGPHAFQDEARAGRREKRLRGDRPEASPAGGTVHFISVQPCVSPARRVTGGDPWGGKASACESSGALTLG